MAKLQSTPLTFGGDWILHPNVSKLWFDTLTFDSVSKSHPRLDFAVNCQVILMMCFLFLPNKLKTTQLQWRWCEDLAPAKRTVLPKEKTNRKSENPKSKHTHHPWAL